MIENLPIEEIHLGERLDKLLTSHYPDYSRSYFQYLIENGFVLSNGKPIKKQHRPSLGDEIEISFQLTPEIDVLPEEIPLDILYEDASLIVINKPVGMVVHPAPGSSHGTFANALLYHCKYLNPSEFDPHRPGIVHRLDKNTSGVLIGAKTHEAHQHLVAQFARRSVEKKYLAITFGTPPEGLFSAPIKRHPLKRQEMAVDPEGKEAKTIFHPLGSKGELSLIEATLITGRTHQIRVHLKTLKTPILGDPIYGNPTMNKKFKLETQLLHAHSLKFSHPLSNTPLEFTAPPPYEMKNFIELIQQR